MQGFFFFPTFGYKILFFEWLCLCFFLKKKKKKRKAQRALFKIKPYGPVVPLQFIVIQDFAFLYVL